ncbi:MAG: Gldg family protein [Planctomycetota bacterium]|nr:Gldg family protein [Planctomycetota bacterium]
MKNRALFSGLGVLIALVLLIGVNLLSGRVLEGVRLDLTENQLFTLSDGSRNVLARIGEPVKLRFFRSREEAEKYIGPFSRRVEEFLREFETASGGKLEVEFLDPEPYSETEERAIAAGLKAYAGAPLAADEQLYFGVVGSNTVGDEKSIAFISPARERFLEYDLAKLVYELSNPKKTVVGIWSSLPIEGQPDPMNMRREAPQAWAFVDQIREFYEVRTVEPAATVIAPEIEVLLVVHPKSVPEPTQYAIDQFVLRGGKLMCFVDPFCDADQPPADPQNPMAQYTAVRSSELPKLFDAWGISSPKDKLATDRKFATPVTWQRRGTLEQVPFTAWPAIPEEGIPEGEVATSELKMLMFKYAGFLEVKEGATTSFTPLVQTSDESMELGVDTVRFSPDPPKLLADFFPSGKKMTLAARIGGKAKSAFPEGRPASAEATEGVAAHLAESQGDISVVVVADVDFLEDRSWVQMQNFVGQRIPFKIADNGDLVVNLLDYMRGSTDLVSLRARGVSAYPFLVVDEIRRTAEQNYRAEEQRLSDERANVERELNDLLSKSSGTTEQVLMSPEVQTKIEDLRKSLVDTNKRLREVRFNLNRDVESLGTRLKVLNILVVPLVVIAAALLVFFYRLNRRKSA